MREQIGDTGTLIAWHSSFEEGRNVLIGKMAPKYKDFMNDLNRRMIDLKLIFKDRYLDYRFKGRAGLKKVLPVLVPKLSYDGLEIQGGMKAAETIYDLVFGNMKNKKKTEKWLLEYCDMDTLAMVRIYEFLLKTIK
ncbi:DUF2779 domain-containing protein [Candidatus Pacearchaeota archaeon]|nr:DUF2779 domain-containing protein [Candidatus Pacearchaeota archaeon]